MLLTAQVCSVAVHGEDTIAELSSSAAPAVMAVTAQLYHLLPLTNHQGVHSLSGLRERPWDRGSKQVNRSVQNLEWPFQSCSVRRCFCTWDKNCLETQIFLCFCFACTRKTSL